MILATVCLRQMKFFDVGTLLLIMSWPISVRVLLSAASSKIRLMKGAIFSSRTTLWGCRPFGRGLPSGICLYPNGGFPATQRPCLALAMADALTRSPVSSRSKADKSPMIPITTRPMAVELSRFSRTERKSISLALNRSIMP
ncbi:MAG TPA: hypothetical protein PKO44_07585 [Candidatus Omnitrophota bacterium]|nr:hypothetical protein [Candidatus Omnitrophota bacterium]